MKNKIKINSKYLEKLGLDVKADEFSEDTYIKRISFSCETEEKGDFLDATPEIDVVRPHIVEEDVDDGYIIGKITSIEMDSDGDVVLPNGLDFSRYTKNPVVLFNHDLSQPIGFAEEIKVNDNNVIAKTRFGSTEEAQKIYQLVKDRVLRTHSIGFIPLEAEVRGSKNFDSLISELKTAYPEEFDEKLAQKVDRIITKSLLLEYSIVTIPANEEAVIQEIKAIKAEKQEKSQELAQELAQESPEVAQELQEKSQKIVEENKKSSIKVIKRANNIKRLSTAKQREQERLKQAYLKLWGV